MTNRRDFFLIGESLFSGIKQKYCSFISHKLRNEKTAQVIKTLTVPK